MKIGILFLLFGLFLCSYSQDVELRNQLRQAIEQFVEDQASLDRFYTAETSKNRFDRFRKFYLEWLGLLEKKDFSSLNFEEKIDYILFKNHLNRRLKELERREKSLEEISDLIPFANTINQLEDDRRKLEFIDAAKAADILDGLRKEIERTKRRLQDSRPTLKRNIANRAAQTILSLQKALRSWFNFYNGYDPAFTWWNLKPYEAVDFALRDYRNFLLEKFVGTTADDNLAIIGDPIGRDALLQELEHEMIPYTPEELIEIANRELQWCEDEMKKASREMGYGDDWKKALEAVKQKYLEPGKQPALIRDQAFEAIEFVEKGDLITVPELAKQTWRMEMMSPERQLVAPFFLGGETILVAYPTNTMTHEQKLMSMRGNNPHFTRAVVHHELIPGHHLQGFMNRRYRAYRQVFRTAFWTEGWALYWEFLLWDLGFFRTPEDKIGALFWRMHRAARIIFSLSFHLEKMTPEECIEFLVNRVGHERDNATAEVRRSFSGDYGPLYQIAYMIGGLQFYDLRKNLVLSGKMTHKQFHDSILKEGAIPVAIVRAILTKQPLSKDFRSNWRFYER
ncbi:MAG: DUF885 domain-containing protein [Pyrinomonadaceae bacterium]|nr:DUF885 domain-containing protein [Pyrinomonadaceae bacterium]